MRVLVSAVFMTVITTGCAGRGAAEDRRIRFARLGSASADAGFEQLRNEFVRHNPGYDLAYEPSLAELSAGGEPRVVFVQAGEAEARVEDVSSRVSAGDVIVLRRGQSLTATPAVAAVVFRVPQEPPPDLPAFIRPDWDPRITDTPGGCATEEGAYRRILLTWQEKKGPYIFHAINAHRVRITDSFTHYHPLNGGFDEFYLVQMVQPNARLLTSHEVEKIVEPESVAADEVPALPQEHVLAVGDLIYMPCGTAHRGLGGALVQVISVPGFRPSAEIGLDHHLAAINSRFELSGDAALPFNAEASVEAVVK